MLLATVLKRISKRTSFTCSCIRMSVFLTVISVTTYDLLKKMSQLYLSISYPLTEYHRIAGVLMIVLFRLISDLGMPRSYIRTRRIPRIK
ncbi:hypothetical protein BDB01DRAFT_789280 [Pilobolus umbonatus]|nr:hypothetical protein BDB01DRAFT_789280 [Pilobolus umbonatus]